MSDPRSGWHPLRMRCPNCPLAGTCETCNGTGWHPSSHVLHEGLFASGLCVAKVEAFSDRGPFYANAVTVDGEPRRSGPMLRQADAMDWCEATAGLLPAARGGLHAETG